jgi:hypothetical protein
MHGQRGVHAKRKTAKRKDSRDALTVMRKFNQNDECKMEVEMLAGSKVPSVRQTREIHAQIDNWCPTAEPYSIC